MATVEAEISLDERGAPGGVVYDGFISYSHAADDLLAPRLQAGLQRFAKPWWKRRALRIFRDESSLSANPHLWSSITDALDQSGWFVLLLSPDAAESPWVNNEVEYWLANEDPDRIIPVLTDGDFTWYDDDFISDAAPPALQGAFSDEPRWVDLRFARTDEQLDLQNPRFSAAVADIASAIRGVPKEELESEEVRQHRRTVSNRLRIRCGAAHPSPCWPGGAALFAPRPAERGPATTRCGRSVRSSRSRGAFAGRRERSRSRYPTRSGRGCGQRRSGTTHGGRTSDPGCRRPWAGLRCGSQYGRRPGAQSAPCSRPRPIRLVVTANRS